MTIIRGTRSPFRAHAAFGAGMRAWMRTLMAYGGGISPAYWPRVVAITTMVALNAPVRWLEKLRYGRRIARTEIHRPVFILGHPRSGTTYLHYILSRDPRFASPAVYESLMPWTFLVARGFLRRVLSVALPATRPMDNVKMSADAPKEEEFALACMGPASLVTGYFFPRRLQQVFDSSVLMNDPRAKAGWQRNLLYFMRKLALRHRGTMLLMKSPANTARVKEILELFPDARFIHIQRDPLTVYASNLHLYNKILPEQALQSVPSSAVRDFVLKSYASMRDKYERDKSLIPAGHLFELRYEEFIGNEMALIAKAYHVLGLDGFEAARPYVAAEVSATYETNKYALSQEEMNMVKETWGLA
jgi:omega-hydroxy-beta-dihydromenaquinone-9 sulfotransferase